LPAYCLLATCATCLVHDFVLVVFACFWVHDLQFYSDCRHTYTRTNKMHLYTLMNTEAQVHAHKYSRTNTRIHTIMHAHTHTCAYTHTHEIIHTHVHTYTYVYTRMNMHTGTDSGVLPPLRDVTYSTMTRATETAQIMGKELGLSAGAVKS
jgi:hypothetical protein